MTTTSEDIRLRQLMDIKTSQKDWFDQAIKLYLNKQAFNLIDDAKLGIGPKDVQSAVNLIKFAKSQHSISWKKITQVLMSAGITGVGIWMIAAAIADPEPTSKLTLLILGGIVMATTGSLGSLWALGIKFTVTAKAAGSEFSIKPD